MKEIIVHTDGSCHNNPGGSSGYGIIIQKDGEVSKSAKGFKHSTNNRMELMAVIAALEQLDDADAKRPIKICSDSKYVTDTFNKKWIDVWVKKGFRGRKNKDLWQALLKQLDRFSDVEWIWVRGHDGNSMNELADLLANEHADQSYDELNEDVGYDGPKVIKDEKE